MYLPLHHLWSSSSGSRLKRRCWGTGGVATGWAVKCEGHRVLTLPARAFISGALPVYFIVPTVLELLGAKHTVLPQEYVVVVCQINTVCTYLKINSYGNTLFEVVCIRLTWHSHNYDMTPFMNMRSLYECLLILSLSVIQSIMSFWMEVRVNWLTLYDSPFKDSFMFMTDVMSVSYTPLQV